MALLSIILLLLLSFNALANTEIINFSPFEVYAASVPFTEHWSVIIILVYGAQVTQFLGKASLQLCPQRKVVEHNSCSYRYTFAAGVRTRLAPKEISLSARVVDCA